MKRRNFLHTLALAPFVVSMLNACKNKLQVKGKITGASANMGHILREKPMDKPASAFIEKKVVIIGAGISGLSAARELVNNNINDFLVLELEAYPGGNSSFGKNEISAYPQGAHYIPIPNIELTEYISFLKEHGVIESFDDKGLPFYNELHLCFDSQERLFLNGNWQEGIIPKRGLQPAELKEIERFLALMNYYRELKGTDGKYAFNIPVNASSMDADLQQLDSITMKDWMLQNKFSNPYLCWYINYCTRDDFATGYDKISAWAGIHYFASRKGKAANAVHSDVLTWPEGNGFLMDKLLQHCGKNVRTNALALSVKKEGENVVVRFMDTQTKNITEVKADECIMACPQYVAARLLNDQERKDIVKQHFLYTPWLVANIKTAIPAQQAHVPLSWDNVIYDSKSLGYVDATHQLPQQVAGLKNLTYYLPFTDGDVLAERRRISTLTHEELCRLVTDDLEKTHPGITEKIEEINVTIWGHSMAQPLPGFISGEVRKKMTASVNDNIHFAHTDIAGISIFEEAFYQGIYAARKIINKV